MKVLGEVSAVTTDGIALSVHVRSDERSFFSEKACVVAVKDTATSRKAFYVGRRVVIEVKPL